MFQTTLIVLTMVTVLISLECLTVDEIRPSIMLQNAASLVKGGFSMLRPLLIKQKPSYNPWTIVKSIAKRH